MQMKKIYTNIRMANTKTKQTQQKLPGPGASEYMRNWKFYTSFYGRAKY